MTSLFDKRWVDLPRGAEELDSSVLAPGFRAGATHCGLKDGGETDVAVLVCDAAEVASSVLLTRNAAAAAPIRVCRENLDAGRCPRDRGQLRERERRDRRAGVQGRDRDAVRRRRTLWASTTARWSLPRRE